jgi:hypothetical protein
VPRRPGARCARLTASPSCCRRAAGDRRGCRSSDDDPRRARPRQPHRDGRRAEPRAERHGIPLTVGGDAALPDDLRTRPAVAAAIADTAEREKVRPGQVVIAAWSP